MQMATIKNWLLNNKLKFAAVGFWLVVLVAANQYMQANDLTFGELTNQLSNTLSGTWYGPLIYLVVYLVRPLILFPASLLTALAGNVFGLGAGFAIALVAGTLSAALPYSIGRWFSSDDEVEDEIKENSRIQKFMDLMRHNPFQAVLIMRLLYLPYDPVSLLAGNLRIPFWKFAAATALANITGTFAYVGIGASIEGALTSGKLQLNPVIFGISATILVISLGVSHYLSNRNDTPDAANSSTMQDTA